jgi:DnaJ-class molecular chaperone
MADTEYYDLLGVDRNADQSTIKKAYYKLSRQYHPDRLSGKEKEIGEEKIKDINHAYDILSDPEKRKLYDSYGKKGLNNPDIFMRRQHQQDIVPPIEVEVKLSTRDIYLGNKIDVTFDRRNLCQDCDGTGCKDKNKHSCVKCNGMGRYKNCVRMGPFIQEQLVICDDCKGKGIDSEAQLCNMCNGNAYVLENHTLKYDIHKGCSTGDKIEISNIGHEIPKFNCRGNVILIVEEINDEIFKRISATDLFVTIDVSLCESLCGFKKVIEHMDGRKLAIVVTDPIKHTECKIIKNEGMPHKNSETIFGDLIIRFTVSLPNDLDAKQKTTIYSVLSPGKDFKEYEDTINKLEENEIYTVLSNDVEKDEHDDNEHGQQNVECCVQ